MKHPNNVEDREDQKNGIGNEIQLGSTRNQLYPLDAIWTTKASYGRDAPVLRSQGGQCSTHSGICSDAVQRSTLQALQNLLKQEITKQDKWKRLKEALTSTYQEVLGSNKHHHREWVSIGNLNEIQESKNKKRTINNSRTRAEKVKVRAEYTEPNKQVKRSIRADKYKYMEELTTTADKAAGGGNMEQLYDTMKKLARKYSKTERPVKDKGETITEIQEQMGGIIRGTLE
ncbi:unnamed protein product [Schistosoma mattheei]|uniref:Uncharacterized protein n=1 Tax=Schistosoma mattheei TaxID=31246 RepID=A0A183P7Q4_9TREM|nr:unnamed protein product [Schistosoma mattheei]